MVKLLVGMMLAIAAMGWLADRVVADGAPHPVEAIADEITESLEKRTEVTCAAMRLSAGVEDCGIVMMSPGEVLELAGE